MGKIKSFFSYYFSKDQDLVGFWEKNKNHKEISKTLKKIFNLFLYSESYELCSNYWKYLNIKNLKQIMYEGGIKNYANTCALNYFTFLQTNLEMEKKNLESLSDLNVNIKGKIFRQNTQLGLKNSDDLNRLILKLYFLVVRLKLNSKLNKLGDKGFLEFNDHFLEINKKKITSDKLISLLDYQKIQENINLSKTKVVLEIGAGSGRFSQTFLTFHKKTKYIICDIPPSIYINYSRLKKIFYNKKIKLCFDCKNYESLSENLDKNDILFIFPHQIKMLKKNLVDLVVAIDCIHEMDKSTIKYYFENINNLSKFIYFSVWKKTRVPRSSAFEFNSNYLQSLSREDYQIPKNWKLIDQSTLYFPENYDGICYKINTTKSTKSKDKVRTK
jgi:putative sugar O-methyltransferase